MTKALSLDLGDSNVRRQLGIADDSPLGGRREVVRLAGDAPGHTVFAAQHGIQSTHALTAAKQEVVVVYRDVLMTVDVYAMPNTPVQVHLFCPRCQKHSTINGARKHVSFEAGAPNPMASTIRASGRLPPEVAAVAGFGRLSIEPFECSWELGDAKHVQGALHTGMTLCRLRLAIDNNRAIEA